MMHDAVGAGPDFERFDVAYPGHRHGDDKVTEYVRAGGAQLIRLRCLEDEVRMTKLPSFRKNGRGRQVSRIAFRRALVEPFLDCRNLAVTQPPFSGELAETRFGQPGRHV